MIDQQDHGRAEQTEPDREHARDAARAERDLQRPSEPRLTGGVRRPDVRPDREPHPGIAGRGAEHRAQDERERAAELDRELRVRRVLRGGQHEEQDDREDREEDADRSELTRQIGARAFLDRASDLLHLVGALGGAEDLSDEVVGEDERDQRDAEDHPEVGGLRRGEDDVERAALLSEDAVHLDLRVGWDAGSVRVRAVRRGVALDRRTAGSIGNVPAR